MLSKTNQKFIGVFDSGFGGLTILRGLVKELPAYNYLYLGDTARNPYGTRSNEVIYEFTKQAVDFMFSNGCELILFACNTASSDALQKIQQDYLPVAYPNKIVLGVLIPAAEEAITKTRNKKIGVIATEATVRSGAFVRELVNLEPKIKVFQNPCPLLVPIVEEGEQNSKATTIILEKYLNPLKRKGIDTLILGCTHYGILENQIKKLVGPNITIISEAKVIPNKFAGYLKTHPVLEQTLGKNGLIHFYSTDLTDKFILLGGKFFGRKIEVQKAYLT